MKSIFLTLAAVMLFAAPSPILAQKGKPTVAIYEMRDLANTGQVDTLSAMIETAITSTGKFRVIERKFNQLLKEQMNAKTGLITTNKPGKVGGFEGSDFLIYGSITTLSKTVKGDMGTTFLRQMLSQPNSGQADCANVVATLGIDIKITDASTGEVRYVTRINEQQKSASFCSGTGQIDASMLMRSAADKIATGLVTSIYPIQIAAVQPDGNIVLNYGEGAVMPGSIMGVYTKGSNIIDPATGDVLGSNETLLGFIRIVDVLPRFSKAEFASQFAVAPAIGSIVRPATENDKAAMSKAGKRK